MVLYGVTKKSVVGQQWFRPHAQHSQPLCARRVQGLGLGVWDQGSYRLYRGLNACIIASPCSPEYNFSMYLNVWGLS